ncbi:MAG: hypothetical protein IJ730_02580 [Alphaproteobacteria bacterium]|nr:hypothetical protein [Alphaproteobacteria bacterium]
MAEEGQIQQQNMIQMLLGPYINPERLIHKYENAKRARQPWDSKWQIIQDQIFPDYRDYLNTTAVKSSPQTSEIKAHTGAVSGLINKVVSLISAKTCDPSVRWLDLKFEDDSLNKAFASREWLHQCREALYRLFAQPRSHFYTSTFSSLLDWFGIGTGCREIILRRDTGEIQFINVPMQDIFIDISGYGDIDITYRRMQLTAHQAYQLWGDALHPKMQSSAVKEDQTPTEQKYEFFEVVMPNPVQQQFPGLKYVSCVIDKSNKSVVDIGMHHMSPYVVSRFFVAPGEAYGRSYVWNAMPTITAINRLNKRQLQLLDYATNPPILVRDETTVNQKQLVPGAFIQGLDIDGRPTYQPMQLGGNLPLLMEYYQSLLRDLEDALVARDVIPAEAPNMTATEVNQREIQAFNRIRPLIVRLETEDLNHTVLRTLKLLEQTGKLPPFPYDNLGIYPEQLPDPLTQLKITFGGQMAKMQRMQEIADNESLMNKTLMAAQQDPSVLDRINLDRIIANDAEIIGNTNGVINSDEVVQQIREQRAKQQEAEQQAQQQTMMIDNFLKLREAGIGATA